MGREIDGSSWKELWKNWRGGSKKFEEVDQFATASKGGQNLTEQIALLLLSN